MNSARLVGLLTATVVLGGAQASAQGVNLRYDLPDRGEVLLLTEVTIKGAGTSHYRHTLAPASDTAAIRAINRASGAALTAKIGGGVAVVALGRTLNGKAERRIAIEERAARAGFIAGTAQRLIFEQVLPPGRVVVVLPPGQVVAGCHPPAQVTTERGRVKLGFVNNTSTTVALRVEARPGASAGEVPFPGSFRAEDDRFIVYWLQDPATHRIDLALEMLFTSPGQSHIYSVLRAQDNITNPATVDLDRGVDLATRIVSGREATALGDAPGPIPADATVQVGDLGFSIPPGGSVRVRLSQTATDAEGFRLLPDGTLRWDRFLGRVRTRAVLPQGWALTAVDQPADISLDEAGRVVLDFTKTSGDSPKLVVTARRSAPGGRP